MERQEKGPASVWQRREADIQGHASSAENIAATKISQYRRNVLCRRHHVAQHLARAIADAVFGV